MMKAWWRTRKQLILEARKDLLRILLMEGNRVGRYEEISLRELPRESLRRHMADLTGGAVNSRRGPGLARGPQPQYSPGVQAPGEWPSAARSPDGSGVTLVLPRSVLIERQFDLGDDDGKDLREVLFEKLSSSLPVSFEELSYGVAIQRGGNGFQGTLLATPLKNLEEILKALGEAGVDPGEIISTDQALDWLARGKAVSGTLILSLCGEEMEAVITGEGRIKASKVFQKGEGSFLQDLQFFLLEAGARPSRVMICGDSDPEMELETGRLLAVVPERIAVPGGVPPALFGASLLGRHPVISLLPTARKIEKRQRERRKLFRETAWLAFALLALVLSGVFLHYDRERRSLTRMLEEWSALERAGAEVRNMISFLQTLEARMTENRRLMDLTKTMSMGVPLEVVLDEFEWERDRVRLAGRSPSYAGVVGTQQVLGKLDVLEAPSLDYARMRKRESREYFEFQVTFQRKGGVLASKTGQGDRGPVSPKSGHWRQDIRSLKENIAEAKGLLAGRNVYQESLNSFKKGYPAFLSPSEILNDWVRELMNLLTSQGLTADALEPKGIDDENDRGILHVEIRVEGSMKALVAFLHPFASSRGGVAIERLKISRQRSGPSPLVHEIHLSRLLSLDQGRNHP